MATDFSRVRHDPLLDWAGVQLKQGGVLLDADANELVAVLDRRLRALASDVLGRATVSQTTPDAFRITLDAGDLVIGRGRLYVDGLLAESHGREPQGFDPLLGEPRGTEDWRYTDQPYLPAPPPLPTAGRHLVYLDAWQREVTPLEHPALIEDAVGVDTGSRLQTVWQVRVLEAEAGRTATCATPDGELAGWADLIAPSEGRLTTGTHEVPPLDDPCELPPTGGFRGLENQLYRVEIHDGGMPGGGATFKWSRENASVGARATVFVSPTELELETLGRDEVLGLADGDWVEILDDAREFSQQPGEMRRIDIPDPGNRRIRFAPALPADMLPPAFPDSTLPGQRNLRVRRWDQRGQVFRTDDDGDPVPVQDLDAPGSDGVVDVPAEGTTLLLEHGVTVAFESTGRRGFRSGDWWVFAARTSDASVERLAAAPPRGTHHHYARLGLWDAGAATVTDCRQPWPPEGGHDCGCTQCVSPESHASGRLTIQGAVDRLRDTGGTVCLQPGQYALQEPVRLSGMRSVTLRGQGPGTVVSAAGTVFAIESSMAVCIEKLAVVSLGQAAAIEVRTVLGLALRELLVFVFAGADSREAAIALSGVCAAVTVRDNLILAPDGIRTQTPARAANTTAQPAPSFALLGAVAIEGNLLYCSRRGIALEGTVAQIWDNRVVANQLLGCRNGGLSALGLGLPGSSLHLEGNYLAVGGRGIACGSSAAWIGRNRLHFSAQRARETDEDGIALVTGFSPDGSEQVHLMANQVTGFSGAGVAIRAPVRNALVQMNIVRGCGGGIVMSEDAESNSILIENNHLQDIRGGNPDANAGIVAGISVVRTEAVTLSGNRVGEVGRALQNRGLVAGVALTGVTRARVHGNEIDGIGPVSEFAGTAAGIVARAPLAEVEIAHNHVRRDDEAQPGTDRWYALAIDAGRVGSDDPTRGDVNHAVGISTVRLDPRRTLVLATGRAYVSMAALDLTDVTAAAPRGAVASVIGNSLSARGNVPAVDIRASAEILFADNRCEGFGPGRGETVRLASPVVVLSANRVRGAGQPSVDVSGTHVTAIGNITRAGIHLQGSPLPSPWNALNLVG